MPKTGVSQLQPAVWPILRMIFAFSKDCFKKKEHAAETRVAVDPDRFAAQLSQTVLLTLDKAETAVCRGPISSDQESWPACLWHYF